MKSVIASAAVLTLVTAPAAAQENIVHLQAKGCSNCVVFVGGINPNDDMDGFNKTVQLRRGKGTTAVPARFTSLQYGIQTKKGWSGKGGQTIIIPQYQFFVDGEGVSNAESRYALKARICIPNTLPESTISFKVHRDPGDKGPRPSRKKNPGAWAYWTPFVLRAWASPTTQGVGRWIDTPGGQAAAQNTVCGL